MNAQPLLDPDPDPDLHAYLDDQLDLEERAKVELALEASSSLRSRMTQFARTRDLVASLPRPELDRDLSSSITQAIADSSRKRRFMMAGMSVASALAACVVFAFLKTQTPPIPAHPRAIASVPASRPSVAIAPSPLPIPAANPSPPLPHILPVEAAIEPALLAAEIKQHENQERLQSLLKMGPTREITILVDRVEPSSFGALEEAIRTSNRKFPEHARISLVQTVTDHPDGPSTTVVYALTMDEVEHANFRKKLEKQFPKAVSRDAPPAADTLASLNDVGTIEIREGEPRSTLMPPPLELARMSDIRQNKSSDSKEKFLGPNGETLVPDSSPKGSLEGARVAQPDAGEIAPHPKTGRELSIVVYLVSFRSRDDQG